MVSVLRLLSFSTLFGLLLFENIFAQTHFTYTMTEDYYSVVINSALVNEIPIENGDEIGVFFLDDGDNFVCGGAIVWPDNGLLAWGDNGQTGEKDGFADGETLVFRIYNSSEEHEYGNVNATWTQGDGSYGNGFYGMCDLSVELNYLDVSPENQNVNSSSGQTTFSILSNLSWIIDESETWLSVSPLSGTGDGSLTIDYDENPSTDERIGTISISGNGITREITITQSGSQTHFNFTPTEDYYSVVISSALLNDISLENGDEVGVFFRDDSENLVCGGAVIWPNNGLLAWGDDGQTTEKDGFDDGETLVFKIYDTSEGQEYNNVEAVWTQGNGDYGTGYYSICDLSVSPETSTQIIPFGDPLLIVFDQTQVTMDFSNSPGGEVSVDLIFTNPPNAGSLALPKYWDITSDMTNGTFNLDLQFSYDNDDVSGLNENALIPVYYDDINSRWKRLLNYSLDTTNNTMTVHNLDHFTIFAMGYLLEFDFILSDVKIFLEAPFASGSMSTTLLDNGDIPLSQPYNVAPWDYAGEESIASIPEEIVDWVLIEIRTGSESSTQITTRAVFLKSDGNIVDLDGISPIGFDDIDASSYYLVVHHRNHLAIMTQSTHGLSESSSLYDFTTNITMYYNSTGATEIETGVWGMWSGDINHDGEVTTSDYTAWYNSARAGDSGYQMTDINQDGQVTTSDYTMWYNNARAGASSSVP